MEEDYVLNDWLEKRALEADRVTSQTEYRSTWPSYYRGLKNLWLQNEFRISSIHHAKRMSDPNYSDPLLDFLDRNINYYNISGGTGFAVFTKK